MLPIRFSLLTQSFSPRFALLRILACNLGIPRIAASHPGLVNAGTRRRAGFVPVAAFVDHPPLFTAHLARQSDPACLCDLPGSADPFPQQVPTHYLSILPIAFPVFSNAESVNPVHMRNGLAERSPTDSADDAEGILLVVGAVLDGHIAALLPKPWSVGNVEAISASLTDLP
jgi:hypothetical protein